MYFYFIYGYRRRSIDTARNKARSYQYRYHSNVTWLQTLIAVTDRYGRSDEFVWQASKDVYSTNFRVLVREADASLLDWIRLFYLDDLIGEDEDLRTQVRSVRSNTVRLGHISTSKRYIIIVSFPYTRKISPNSQVNLFLFSPLASHGCILLRPERSTGGGPPSGRRDGVHLAGKLLRRDGSRLHAERIQLLDRRVHLCPHLPLLGPSVLSQFQIIS